LRRRRPRRRSRSPSASPSRSAARRPSGESSPFPIVNQFTVVNYLVTFYHSGSCSGLIA
jgi:hypothetical protein